MSRTKGSVIKLDNTECKEYLRDYALEIYDWDSFKTFCPRWLDDVLEGAGGQMTGTRTPSPYQIFMKLAHINIISTETVGELLIAYSKTYIEQWTNVLKCASQAVLYHKVGKAKFNARKEGKTYRECDLNVPVAPTSPRKVWLNGAYYTQEEYDAIEDKNPTVIWCGKEYLAKDLHAEIMKVIK